MKGSVYRKTRPDGRTSRWYAVIDLSAGGDGRRRQRTSTHDSKREAQAWLAHVGQITRSDIDPTSSPEP